MYNPPVLCFVNRFRCYVCSSSNRRVRLRLFGLVSSLDVSVIKGISALRAEFSGGCGPAGAGPDIPCGFRDGLGCAASRTELAGISGLPAGTRPSLHGRSRRSGLLYRLLLTHLEEALGVHAAARVGFIKAVLRCSSLIIFSSSSLALTLETPKDTISRPRRSRHFADSSWFKASASSVVWPGRAEYRMPISLIFAKAGCSAVSNSVFSWPSMVPRSKSASTLPQTLV